ncbi:MAG: DegT/DnrJ/EryC1/StrS family aminotransferase [Bacteroidales bacterium]|jgi:dTDP-4-amino-4,6-dideoxygalactose transaminase|nr:DegT/DnrJ/EryC1/StrS family aminotransferase [Bacteroidales bacterium]
MPIPFSPPRIDEENIAAVNEVLRSGWITTGPRTKEFERQISDYCGVQHTICLNSATAGLELALRWFGVQEGDEVILPAYTYCASANVIAHCGAKPVMVDINDDFTIDPEKIRAAITPKTKAIIPVDIAGLPCHYDEIMQLAQDESCRKLFTPQTENQQKLGRVLVLSDAAHSFGAQYKNRRTGSLADITVFSFHAVKNLTTAEGGAVCLHLPDTFDEDEIYHYLCRISLHGQSKDALSKTFGNWRYDVYEAGYKCNMTDIQAAIGLVELNRYAENLQRRRAIFQRYSEALSKYSTFQLPEYEMNERISSYHIFPLRIHDCTEEERNRIMEEIFQHGVSVNVHFIPLPMLTFYKNSGYSIENYPKTYDNYSREISLPVYFTLTNDQVETVIEMVIQATNKVITKL